MPKNESKPLKGSQSQSLARARAMLPKHEPCAGSSPLTAEQAAQLAVIIYKMMRDDLDIERERLGRSNN